MPNAVDLPTVAILVGGLGTRLQAVTGGDQKVIAPVAGRPFLFRLLDQIADAGLRDVVLCTGHRAGQVAEAIGEEYRGLRVRYSRESRPLGTAGALRNALPLLLSDPVLAMNGDSCCGLDLALFREFHARTEACASIGVCEVEDTSASGLIEFDAHKAITCFNEKTAARTPGWINAGVYLLGRELLLSIPVGKAVSIEREIFPAWVGRRLYAYPIAGKFIDIGTPETYAAAHQLLA